MEHKDGGQERRAVCPGAARCQLAQRLMEHKDGGQERRGSLVHPRHRGLQAQDHPGLLTGSREGKKDSPGLRRADGQVVPVRLAGGAALLVWALQLLQLKRALGGGAHHRMDRGQPGEGLERGCAAAAAATQLAGMGQVGRALGKEGNASGEAALDALAAMVVVVPLFGPGGGPPKRGKKSTAVTAVLWGLVGQHPWLFAAGAPGSGAEFVARCKGEVSEGEQAQVPEPRGVRGQHPEQPGWPVRRGQRQALRVEGAGEVQHHHHQRLVQAGSARHAVQAWGASAAQACLPRLHALAPSISAGTSTTLSTDMGVAVAGVPRALGHTEGSEGGTGTVGVADVRAFRKREGLPGVVLRKAGVVAGKGFHVSVVREEAVSRVLGGPGC
eukprot:1139584-Pelagomonas_calceolata.AAC.1